METRVASSCLGHNASHFQHVIPIHRRPHGVTRRRTALRGMTFTFWCWRNVECYLRPICL